MKPGSKGRPKWALTSLLDEELDRGLAPLPTNPFVSDAYIFFRVAFDVEVPFWLLHGRGIARWGTI